MNGQVSLVPIPDPPAGMNGSGSANGPGSGDPHAGQPEAGGVFTNGFAAHRSVPAFAAGTPSEPAPGTLVPASTEPRWEDEVARLLRSPETLRCVYQPVVDLRTGDVSGFEAFTRVANWPARSPQPWFTAAARTGLAGRLEAATLTNALHGRSALVGDQFLAVNVAAPLVDDPAVVAVLESQGTLDGLVVELGWFDDPDADTVPTAALDDLRSRGALIACDVADAGRADLERLRRTAPDLVKLDGALVRGCHSEPVLDRLLRLVVGMAEELGAVVLAEGLESLDDARHLQFVGVRMAQGWLFGRARPSFIPPSAEVVTWLRTTWQETITRTRVARLARPVPAAENGRPVAGAEWSAVLDDSGHLVSLVQADGTLTPAARLLRLRSSQDLRSAAVRVLASGGDRRSLGVIVIVDDDGRFVGVSDSDAVLRQMLASADGRSPLPLR